MKDLSAMLGEPYKLVTMRISTGDGNSVTKWVILTTATPAEIKEAFRAYQKYARETRGFWITVEGFRDWIKQNDALPIIPFTELPLRDVL